MTDISHFKGLAFPLACGVPRVVWVDQTFFEIPKAHQNHVKHNPICEKCYKFLNVVCKLTKMYGKKAVRFKS